MCKGTPGRFLKNRDSSYVMIINILKRKPASVIVKIVTNNLTILTCLLERWNVFSELFPTLRYAHIGTSPVNISLDRVSLDMHCLRYFQNGIAHPMKITYTEFANSQVTMFTCQSGCKLIVNNIQPMSQQRKIGRRIV